MPATPATLNHLRNSTIATFFFFLLLIATLSTAIAISTVALPNDPDYKKRTEAGIILQILSAAAGTVLAVCTLTTFGLGMQIPPLRK